MGSYVKGYKSLLWNPIQWDPILRDVNYGIYSIWYEKECVMVSYTRIYIMEYILYSIS